MPTDRKIKNTKKTTTWRDQPGWISVVIGCLAIIFGVSSPIITIAGSPIILTGIFMGALEVKAGKIKDKILGGVGIMLSLSGIVLAVMSLFVK